MTPDIATAYCALVHIKTTGCGDDFPCSRRFLHAHAWRYASVSNGCQEGTLRDGMVPQKTLLSFTDIPKSQTLIPLKSQKTDDFCIPFPSRCIRKLASSPDHLISLDKDGCRHRDAQGLGRLEVDAQLELHRLLHRQVGRLDAFEDL